MHLVLAPTVGDGKSIETAWRPLVPEQLARAWREASSDWAGSGQTLVYLTEGTDEDLAACEELGGSIVKAATTQDMAETVALFEAVKAEGAPPLFEERPALDDVVSKIMQDVVPVVNAKREADGKLQLLDAVRRIAKDAGAGAVADLAGKIVPLILLGAPLHVLLQLFAGHRGIYALTTLHQDNFNRSNGALHGMTMSDGLGAWAQLLGTDVNVIGTSEIQQNGGGGTQVYWDSAMSDVDEQRVVAKMTGENAGPAARAQSNGDCYFGYWRPASNDNRLYRYESGYNFLGSGTANVNLNETCGVYAHGTTIINEANGVTDITVTGQTSFPTGRGGLYMDTPTTSKMDDWRVDTAVVSGAIACAVGGTGTVAADLKGSAAAAAAIAAGGTVAANLQGSGVAQATIAGSASVTANLAGAAPGSCAIAGAASVAAALQGAAALVCAIAAGATVADDLLGAGQMTCALAGVGSAACNLTPPGGIGVSITGVGAADLGLSGAGPMLLAVAAAGTVTASLAGAGALAAAIAAAATVSATLHDLASVSVDPRSVGVRRAGGFRVVRAGGYRVRTP